MARWSDRYSEVTYFLLRVVAGLLFAQHGVQKVFGLLGGKAVPLHSIYGLAGVLELVGGVLIALGLPAGWVALILAGEMAVAYFWRHAPRALFPIQNGGELAALYSFIFLYISARGGGRWRLSGR